MKARRGLRIAVLGAAVLAGGVALLTTWPPGPEELVTAPVIGPDGQPVPTISTLSDSHLVADDSWFRLTVAAGRLDGYAVGTYASQPGADAETVRQLAGRTDGSDWVVVQAGTNDLLGGASPAEAFTDVQALVRAVRGPRVILALVPPANERPAAVVELNRLLREWAESQDIAVLDVYSAVATGDGRFLPGTSDDDVHVNGRGAQLQADAATRQLRRILP